jgi:hypothetical protein
MRSFPLWVIAYENERRLRFSSLPLVGSATSFARAWVAGPNSIWASRVGVDTTGAVPVATPTPASGRPSPQRGGIQLPPLLKSQTPQEAGFNFVICNRPAHKGERYNFRHCSNRKRPKKRASISSYAIALPQGGGISPRLPLVFICDCPDPSLRAQQRRVGLLHSLGKINAKREAKKTPLRAVPRNGGATKSVSKPDPAS